ncbi:unnamed protein product [Cuscuta campestris]|uniref:Uncharacterized protein n=1 Tax=Cuscuta campestris TaxID=132261 RepID=A0A484KNZ6_9ASTE|nr:unnamed protein product [Cuscuta campestris]
MCGPFTRSSTFLSSSPSTYLVPAVVFRSASSPTYTDRVQPPSPTYTDRVQPPSPTYAKSRSPSGLRPRAQPPSPTYAAFASPVSSASNFKYEYTLEDSKADAKGKELCDYGSPECEGKQHTSRQHKS